MQSCVVSKKCGILKKENMIKHMMKNHPEMLYKVKFCDVKNVYWLKDDPKYFNHKLKCKYCGD